MKMHSLFVVILAVAISGCTYGNRISYETTRRPPTNPASVEVFDVKDVTRPYKVIGIVSSDSWYMHSALKACRTEAAALGANAIIDFGPNGNTSGVGVANPMGAGALGMGSSYNTGFAAKAIVWNN
jgi:hypothetical protein